MQHQTFFHLFLVLICQVLFGSTVESNDGSTHLCPDVLSVSLANATTLEDGLTLMLDGVQFPPKTQFRDADGLLRGCPCIGRKCIRLCCEPGDFFDYKKCHKPWNGTGPRDTFDIPDGILDSATGHFDQHFHVLRGKVCEANITGANFYATGEMAKLHESFHVASDGVLTVVNTKIDKTFIFKPEGYCIAWSQTFNATNFHGCERSDVGWIDFGNVARWITGVGYVLSTFFFLLTLIVYSMFAQLRNLHGKTVMAYVVCFATASFALQFIKHEEIVNTVFKDKREYCITTGTSFDFKYTPNFNP